MPLASVLQDIFWTVHRAVNTRRPLFSLSNSIQLQSPKRPRAQTRLLPRLGTNALQHSLPSFPPAVLSLEYLGVCLPDARISYMPCALKAVPI